jgi:hypothetical protein
MAWACAARNCRQLGPVNRPGSDGGSTLEWRI